MEWISLQEKQPHKDGSPFLGYNPTAEDNGKIYVLIYVPAKKYEGTYSFLSHEEYYQEAAGEGYFRFDPSHWMPLPQPPKNE